MRLIYQKQKLSLVSI